MDLEKFHKHRIIGGQHFLEEERWMHIPGNPSPSLVCPTYIQAGAHRGAVQSCKWVAQRDPIEFSGICCQIDWHRIAA